MTSPRGLARSLRRRFTESMNAAGARLSRLSRRSAGLFKGRSMHGTNERFARDGSGYSSPFSLLDFQGDESLLERLAQADGFIARELEVAVNDMTTSVRLSCRAGAERALKRGLALSAIRKSLADVRRLAVASDGVPVYVVGSIFLAETYRFLVKDPAVDMHFVTGCEYGPQAMGLPISCCRCSSRTASWWSTALPLGSPAPTFSRP